MAQKNCKCGAEPHPEGGGGWVCDSAPDMDDCTKITYSKKCLQRQARHAMARLRNLAEFRYNAEAIYNAWSTNEKDATQAMTELAALILAMPMEETI